MIIVNNRIVSLRCLATVGNFAPYIDVVNTCVLIMTRDCVLINLTDLVSVVCLFEEAATKIP